MYIIRTRLHLQSPVLRYGLDCQAAEVHTYCKLAEAGVELGERSDNSKEKKRPEKGGKFLEQKTFAEEKAC